MKSNSTILVPGNEDSKSDLVARLKAEGVPAQRISTGEVDVTWTVDGEYICFDLKTPTDLIASADDGRLHSQSEAMKKRNPILWGYIIEGRQVSTDGYTVGYGPHAWSINRYENLVLSLQAEGATILHSEGQSRTAERIKSIYRWTEKDSHGTIHKAVRPAFTLDNGPADPGLRAHIQALMTWPGMGQKRAEALLDRYTWIELNGATREGLQVAQERWVSTPGIGKVLADRWAKFHQADYTIPLKHD